jgi:ATP-dependent DNA helicase DinG
MNHVAVPPDAPAIAVGAERCAVLTVDGELLNLPLGEAARLLRAGPPPLLVHAPATLLKLGLRGLPAFDILELFAFVLPGRPASPTPRGLALALDIAPAAPGLEPAAASMPALCWALLTKLTWGRETRLNRDAPGMAARMGQAGWNWAPYVLAALQAPNAAPAAKAFQIWKSLPEWEETAPPPPPGTQPVTQAEARARLAGLLGPHAEQRQGQSDFAAAAAAAFTPREQRGDPRLVLAEAGTGTGKTLGYLAPASLWAERNGRPVWISTFTRHLQRQIETELARIFPDPVERRRRTVVRKGRENYLCLLNLEDAVMSATSGIMPANAAIALGLLVRWAAVTMDGDIQGGDLPGWLGDLFPPGTLAGLADRRGECIHGGCPHYRRCFVEHTIRRARTADVVVANHALVMAQSAWGGIDDNNVPSHLVFDEGHHVFDAADGAFSAVLSGVETAELRRWLVGAEGGRSRARGLRRRLEELVAGRPALEAPIDAALLAARALPGPGWAGRLSDAGPALDGIAPGQPHPTESFLREMRSLVMARLAGGDQPTTPNAGVMEGDLHPVPEDLKRAAERLERALGRIVEPLKTFAQRLAARLEEPPESLDEAGRNRIEGMGRSLRRRALERLEAWQAMLRSVAEPPAAENVRPKFVDFLRLERRGAADRDVALHRHWLDPTEPFAATVAAATQGVLITSATLRDAGAEDSAAAWTEAERRTGAVHLPTAPLRASVASPFDYAGQTRAFIVTDVPLGNDAALAAAYQALFQASGGGGLGLFTAIRRLQAVYARIAPALENQGIPVLAQHVDAMDNATLVDIFRTEEESCLLGTDAMRDGVDVPGRACRLVVFERLPWPRPDILHRERRRHLSGGNPTGYDDAIARLRLRQAFGRLVRRASDRGVFVLLDRRTPSRMLSAFPPGVRTERVSLAQAVAGTAAFLMPRDEAPTRQ